MKVFIGFDARERDAYLVAAHTLRRHASCALAIEPLMLEPLRWKRLYTRPHELRNRPDAAPGDRPVLWDCISNAPMSTEFALTRFLVPHLAAYRGWALYLDCDFLFRRDVAELLDLANPAMAVQVVQHAHLPEAPLKMDGQIQTAYARKNWSSLVLWNCAHEAHAGTLERVARWRGLSLHQFRWIQDAEIGSLPKTWNWLEGSRITATSTFSEVLDPAAVHFTRGTPDLPGYENVAFADEWRAARAEATGLVHA